MAVTVRTFCTKRKTKQNFCSDSFGAVSIDRSCQPAIKPRITDSSVVSITNINCGKIPRYSCVFISGRRRWHGSEKRLLSLSSNGLKVRVTIH